MRNTLTTGFTAPANIRLRVRVHSSAHWEAPGPPFDLLSAVTDVRCLPPAVRTRLKDFCHASTRRSRALCARREWSIAASSMSGSKSCNAANGGCGSIAACPQQVGPFIRPFIPVSCAGNSLIGIFSLRNVRDRQLARGNLLWLMAKRAKLKSASDRSVSAIGVCNPKRSRLTIRWRAWLTVSISKARATTTINEMQMTGAQS